MDENAELVEQWPGSVDSLGWNPLLWITFRACRWLGQACLMTGGRRLRSARRHPGPVYDTAIHAVLEGDPVAVCQLLGIEVTTASGVPEVLSGSFAYPVGALYADLVMRTGPGRLAHVEFERRLTAKKMVIRMMGYRWAIQRRHRQDVLSQYLVVLGGGGVSEFIDAEEVEMKPEDREALHEHVLWMLAEGKVARLLAKPGDLERAQAERDLEYRAHMDAIKGRGEILRVLIEDRFGPHPVIPEVARLLADQWEADAAVHVIGRCADLAELAALVRISLAPA